MSIEKRQRKKGTVYRVWWRQDGRNRNRSFDRKRDAVAYEAKLTLAKRRGDLGDLDAGKQRLSEFMEEWWERYVLPTLEETTRNSYRRQLDELVIPRLGSFALREVRPDVVDTFASDLRAAGVGEESIRRTLAMMQGAMRRAVVWGRITTNPVAAVTKPPRRRTRVVRPVHPNTVETMRADLRRRKRPGDATLVSVLAYSGMRPGEALALTWSDVLANTLIVEKSLALGEVKDTKTRRNRTVRLLRPVSSDLAEWRMASGRPSEQTLIFPMRDGRPWTDTKYRNWRSKIYVRTAEAAGLVKPRPYDLRHSFASLLFAEGVNPAEIAEQMGHSLQMLFSTYAHVMEELRGQAVGDAEALIREAREKANVSGDVTQTSPAGEVAHVE